MSDQGRAIPAAGIQCRRFPLGGGQCELAEGHEGKHQRGTFTWTDEGQKRLAREWERRGGGWD